MLRTHRTLLAAAALGSALAGAPAAAQASPITLTHHDVTVEGEYSYSLAKRHTEKGFERTEDLVASGTLASSTGKLTFAYDAEGRPQDIAEMRADYDLRTASSGSYRLHEEGEFSDPFERRCSVGEGEGTPPASGYVQRSLLQPLVGTDVAMEVRLATSLPIPFQGANCAGLGPVLSSDAWEGQGRFDADFSLPREAVTAGKTIQLVSGGGNEPCPGSEDPEATACKLTWSAKITLVKTGTTTVGDDEPVPSTSTPVPAPTPSTSTPAPAPAPAPAPVDTSRSEQAMADAVHRAIEEQRAQEAAADGAKVDAVSRAIRDYLQAAKAEVGASGASVDVALPAGSTGRLSAEAIARRNAKAGTSLGSAWIFPEMATRAVAPGGATTRMTARVRFDAADRRAVHRGRFVRLTLRVRAPGASGPVVVRKVVRVKR